MVQEMKAADDVLDFGFVRDGSHESTQTGARLPARPDQFHCRRVGGSQKKATSDENRIVHFLEAGRHEQAFECKGH
jgi:hypothetical protein